MKILSLFDTQVSLLLTEVSDGNMKAVPGLSNEQLSLTRQNRLNAVQKLDLSGLTTALLKITYGTDDFCKFTKLAAPEHFCLNNDFSVDPADGILTCTPNLGIFLPLADCLGLVLFDPRESALMVVHCGRHTLLQNGAHKAVHFMDKQLGSDAKNLMAWTSPCAGKDNYPLYDAGGRGLQDLVTEQLTSAGLLVENIELSPVDTTTSASYYSHSQGDTANRFAICAKLNGQYSTT